MKPVIVQFLPELNVGGVERGTIEIARAIVAEGFRSVVVSNGGRLVEQLLNEGSEHISLPIHKKALASLRLIKKLKPILEEADIAHVRSRMPAWLVSLALKSIKPEKRPKLVSTAHGLYSVNPYSRIMTKGDALIAISKTVEHYLIKNYPDFPKGGIVFKDILPILQNPDEFSLLIKDMSENKICKEADAIVAIDARGFIFGTAISIALSKPAFTPLDL